MQAIDRNQIQNVKGSCFEKSKDSIVFSHAWLDPATQPPSFSILPSLEPSGKNLSNDLPIQI